VNTKGFTLIETLLVLSIVAIISSVTIIQLKPQSKFLENQLFLSQLKSDFYVAQQYAISHQQEITFVIDQTQKRYYFRSKSEVTPIIVRFYPPTMTWQAGSMPLTFKFLHDGNVNQFGSLYFYLSEKSYKLTFLLGEGRFYVEEK
jgi:competence protein ComGD